MATMQPGSDLCLSPRKLIKFIDAVEKNECLWNPADSRYKNNTAKREAEDKIAEEMRPLDVNWTVKPIMEAVRVLGTEL